MRIVFVENEDINRDSSGGVMSYLLNLSRYIRQKGGWTLLIGSGIADPLNVKNKFSHFLSISKSSTISNMKFFVKLFTTKELNNIQKGDIIHVQRPEMVLPIYLRKRNKIICTLHGAQDLAVLKKKGKVAAIIYSIMQLISFVFVDKLIVVDQKNLTRYLKKYPWLKKKIRLISIAVDTDKFYPMNKELCRKKYDFDVKDKIILFIGRLEYEKNVEFLIDSFNSLKDKTNKLLIIGTGSLLEKLQEKANNRVHFLGEINNSLIPEIINTADVLVLCSYFEGSPTVVKEALCCNVPVISTDVGDVKEVLETVNGGVIIDHTKKSIIKAFDDFLKKKAINKEVSTLFSFKRMGEKTMQIYNNLYA